MYLKYQVPCGKVDPGESSLQAAWRETKEETDLAIPAQRFQFLGQNKFKLITDHKALETLRKQELSLTARRTRWILELE